jgi:signal transduction histidine kinase
VARIPVKGWNVSVRLDLAERVEGPALAFESVEGEGTTFVITLPAPEEARAAD